MATPIDEAAASNVNERTEPEEELSVEDSCQQALQLPDFEEDFVVLDSLNEDEIDFTSPHFNPSVALKTDNIVVPSPETPSFKSLSSYEDAVNRRRQQRISKDKSDGRKVTSKSDTKRSVVRSRSDHNKPRCEEKHRSSSSKVSDSGRESRHKSTSERQKDISQKASRSSSKSRYGTSSSRDEERQRSKTKQTEEEKDRRDRGSLSHKEEKRKNSPPPKQVQRREVRNVFTRMEAMTGPLSFLSRCVKNREHVRVVTRGAVSLSSICRGYIVAFDKYCNMALIDVDEIYRRPAALGKVKARISHKLVDAQATLKQESKDQKAQWQATQKQSETKIVGPNGSARLSATSDKNQNIPNLNLNASRKDSKTEDKEKRTRIGSGLSKQILAMDSHFTSLKPVRDPDSTLNPKLLKSVYSSVSVPRSRFEREALLLGIPDENVEHRHLNQVLLRGENVVSISIIQEF